MITQERKPILGLPTKVNTVSAVPVVPFATETNNFDTDLLEALTKVTPAAQKLFIKLKRTHTLDLGICNLISPDEKSSSAYKVYSRHIVALKNVDLLKRLSSKYVKLLKLDSSKYHYILNPFMIRSRQQHDSKKMWKLL